MTHNFKDRLFIVIGSTISEPGVPDTDKSVIWATGEDAGVEFVPGNILNGCIMMKYLENGHKPPILLLVFLYVPDTNSLVWKTWQQQVFLNVVPTKPIPICSMTH